MYPTLEAQGPEPYRFVGFVVEPSGTTSETIEKAPRQPRKLAERVSDDLKKIIFGRYVDGISTKDIAKKLKLSYKTVARIIRTMRTNQVISAEENMLETSKELIMNRVALYMSISPILTARDIQHILAAEGLFLAEKDVTPLKKGLHVSLRLKCPAGTPQVILNDAAFILGKCLEHQDTSLQSGIIYLAFKQMEVIVRRIGCNKSEGSEGAGMGVRTDFSMLLATCGDGMIFFDSQRYHETPPSILDSLEKMLAGLTGTGRTFMVSNDFPVLEEFRSMAGKYNHTVYNMPNDFCHCHLADVLFYNLPRWVKAHQITNRCQVETLLEHPESVFQTDEIKKLYLRIFNVFFNTNPITFANLPPSRGIIPRPLLIPDKSFLLKARDQSRNGGGIPAHDVTSILRDYEDMYCPFKE